jgi:hypothetical protein
MPELKEVAPAFIEMAHDIVWCAAATVDRRGRPRSRILHPIWEFDGETLVGWIATTPTPLKRAHLAQTPYMSCTYLSGDHNTCIAECAVEWRFDDETRTTVWDRFKNAPPPVGYDPAIISAWPGPTSEQFAVLRLEPWRLRLVPGIYMLSGGAKGDLLSWKR